MPQLKSGLQVDKTDLADINSLLAKLEDFPIEVLGAFDSTKDKTVQEMKKYAPYDTGRLQRNIEGTVTPLDNGIQIEFESTAIDPDTKVDYAPIQEYGGRNFRGSHYFMPAVKGAAKTLIHRLTQTLKTLINKGK